MKNIYLCGPVTGKEKCDLLFNAVERKINNAAEKNGVPVCTHNPTRFCPPYLDWHKAMRLCASELVKCDGIALLQGWQRSRGAALELKLAQDLHIPVVYVEPPLDLTGLNELFTAAPETLRYYNAGLTRFQHEGVEESLAEDRSTAELANRYLDPHGFEYIEISQEE